MRKKLGIILAGGRGKRIANFKNPKVLLKVGNKTLLENHIEGFLKVFEVDKIVLVINDSVEELRVFSSYLKEKYKGILEIVFGQGHKYNLTKYGFDLLHVFNKFPDYELYIYVMGDHYIDYSTLAKNKEKIKTQIEKFSNQKDTSMAIFIDKNIRCVKPEAQSKVLLDNSGLVIDHGKNLERWSALETGLIIIKRDALVKISSMFDMSTPTDFDTSDILKIIKKEGNTAIVIDISGICWFGVNTFDEWIFGINHYIKHKLTLKETIKLCKEGKAGVLAHALYKYIAALITFIILKIKSSITAEDIALFTYLATFPSLVLAYFYPIWGAIAYLFLEIIDSVDGTIARLKNTCNDGGGLIDWGAGILRHTLIPAIILWHYNLIFYAFLYSLLTALKYRLKWSLAAVLVSFKGKEDKLALLGVKQKRVIFGFSGDIMATIVLIAVIMMELNIGTFYLTVPSIIISIIKPLFFIPSTVVLTPIEVLALFLVAIYLVMATIDVIKIPKVGLRMYHAFIEEARKGEE